MANLYISAAHKSSGKTVIATGLCAALRDAGRSVQPFKKGPDYIDPMWLGAAAGRPCRNLDFHTMSSREVLDVCHRFGAAADVTVVEGTKGLHDGVAVDGSDSNATLAKLLRTPVVLVFDVRGMTRGIAPLLSGQAGFDEDVCTAGVILNRVGGARHESKLRAAIERYTDIPVLGAVAEHRDLMIPEGHLGLLPANDHPEADALVERLAGVIRDQVDVDRLLEVSGRATWSVKGVERNTARSPSADLRVGVARDAAFGFYYPEDLEGLRAAGAELVFFDTLCDASMPEVDALYIGGGFPERHLDALAANQGLRRSLKDRIEAGMPVYAECGGLMYLCRHIEWQGVHYPMVGAIEADVVMRERPQGRGYVVLRETGRSPWPRIDAAGGHRTIHAHEFHYSELSNCSPRLEYAYEVLRGRGVDGKHDGIVAGNVLASFSHLRDVAAHPWTECFVSFARDCREGAPGRRSRSIGL